MVIIILYGVICEWCIHLKDRYFSYTIKIGNNCKVSWLKSRANLRGGDNDWSKNPTLTYAPFWGQFQFSEACGNMGIYGVWYLVKDCTDVQKRICFLNGYYQRVIKSFFSLNSDLSYYDSHWSQNRNNFSLRRVKHSFLMRYVSIRKVF